MSPYFRLKFKRKNISQKNNNHKSCFYRYDNRKVFDEVIKLFDNKGKSFIYGINCYTFIHIINILYKIIIVNYYNYYCRYCIRRFSKP